MRRLPISPVPPRDLLVKCVAGAGYRRGMRLALFIHSWATVEADFGRTVSPEEFGDYWGHGTKRTAYARLAEFRDVFDPVARTKRPSDVLVWPDGYPSTDAVESDRVGFNLEAA